MKLYDEIDLEDTLDYLEDYISEKGKFDCFGIVPRRQVVEMSHPKKQSTNVRSADKLKCN